MAYLALLRQLQQHVVADLELRAERQRHKVDALGGDVLGEIAFLHVQAARPGLLDGFPGQKRNLAVPVSGVRVLGDAVMGLDGHRAVHHGLARALALGHADGAHGAVRGAFGVRPFHAALVEHVELLARLVRSGFGVTYFESVVLAALVFLERHDSPNKPSK